MEFSYSFGTDVGRKRSKNQDNGIVVEDLGLFIVADGMGGHKGGEIASQMSVEIVPDTIRKQGRQRSRDPKVLLKDAIWQANNSIYDKAKKAGKQLAGMGTTTTSLLFKSNKLTVGHVGDSRCYYYAPDRIWQITRDHSLVEEKIRAGLITRAQAKSDMMRNVITRSVGFEPTVNVDLYEMKVNVGDTFLICSDGLSGPVSDQTMLEILQKNLGSLSEESGLDTAVRELIEAANNNGGDDNITVLLVQVAQLGQGDESEEAETDEISEKAAKGNA